MDIAGVAAEADASWNEASESEVGVAPHLGRAKPRRQEDLRDRLACAARRTRDLAVTALQRTSHRLDRTIEPLRERLAPIAATARPIAKRIAAYLPSLPHPSTLVWKIFLCNLVGLVVLVGGLLYMSRKHDGLIETKRESLRTQAEIIAAAIEGNTLAIDPNEEIDPDRVLEGGGERIGPGSSDLSELEYPIRPEGVAPTLRGLVRPTGTRARIFDPDGHIIIDSKQLLNKGEVVRFDLPLPGEPRESWRDRVKTRINRWLAPTGLPTYREAGITNGKDYAEVAVALSGEPTSMLSLTEKGEQIVSVAVPVKRVKRVLGVLLLSTHPGDIDGIIAGERRNIGIVTLMAMAATLLTSLLLARTIAGPMRRLSKAAEDVRENINARGELPDFSNRRDEIAQLGGAFRDMTFALLKRIETSEKFAADVAHELKNPITAVRSISESLAYAKTDEQRQELVQIIQKDLSRLNRLITDISSASRVDAELSLRPPEPIDVAGMLQTIVSMFNDRLVDDGRRVVLGIAPASSENEDYVINGHDTRLSQVITNLIDNALSFSPTGGIVTVSARHVGAEMEVAVTDDGPGIPSDRLERIFERFYTDRPSTEAAQGKNSGLGLSIAREIIAGHGGRLWAENVSPENSGTTGARFVFCLPMTGGHKNWGQGASGRKR